MSEGTQKYRAICFDLDGTLLPMDIDEFMTAYFSRIATYAAENGLDPELFIKALKSGTKAMAKSSDERLNKDVFWDEFYRVYDRDRLAGFDVEAMASAFYLEEFEHIGDGFSGDPLAAKAVGILHEKGYPLLLTTMPMFPLQAVKKRLGWAGVDPSMFERITTYENSRSTKPRHTYFAENLAAMGLRGEDVLMVGNNTMEDLAFLDLGADAYLVTDYLLDPVGFDVSLVKHGTLQDFVEWVESLPECEDPVRKVSQGAVSREDMLRSFEANAVGVTLEEGESNARRLADAIENDKPLGK